MSLQLLKEKIVEKNLTPEVLADKLGIDRATFYKKINKRIPFSIEEADFLVNVLSLTGIEATMIFFPDSSVNTMGEKLTN